MYFIKKKIKTTENIFSRQNRAYSFELHHICSTIWEFGAMESSPRETLTNISCDAVVMCYTVRMHDPFICGRGDKNQVNT